MELKNYYAQDSEGNILPGATCHLYLAGTETLAEGLEDANGNPLDNPFAARSDGLVQFAAPNGRYDLNIAQGGRVQRIRIQCNDVAGNVQKADLADAADPELGAVLVGRGVVALGSIVDLLAVPAGVRRPDLRFEVRGYHAGTDIGGGSFYWDAERPKSDHNGGTVISPTVPWDGERDSLADFLSGAGETDPDGAGCLVRTLSVGASAAHFGADLDGSSDAAAINAFDEYDGINSPIYSDNLAPVYLKTTADILNGEVSILRFVDRQEHAKIRSGTSTLDLNPRFQEAVLAVSDEAGRGEIRVPYGTYYKPGTLNMAANVSITSEGGSKIVSDSGGSMILIDAVTGVNLRGLALESLAAGDGITVNGFCTSNISDISISGFKRGIHESGSGVGENYIIRCNIEVLDMPDSFGIWADTTDNWHAFNKVKGASIAYRSRGGANKWVENHSFRHPSSAVEIGYLIEGVETQINGGRCDTCSNANIYFGSQGIGNDCTISGVHMSTASAYPGAAFFAFDGAQILELDDVYSIDTDATITNGAVTGKVYLTDSAGTGGNTRAYVNRRDGTFLNGDSVTIEGVPGTAQVVSRVRPRIVGLNAFGNTFNCREVAQNGVASHRIDPDVDLQASQRTTIMDNVFDNVDAFATRVRRVLTTDSGNSVSTNLGSYLLGDVAHAVFSSMGGGDQVKLDTITNDPNKNLSFSTIGGGAFASPVHIFLEAESLVSANGRDFYNPI